LLSAAQDAYASASKVGGSAYASVTSYLAKQTDAAKDTVFDTWSESGKKKIPAPPFFILIRDCNSDTRKQTELKYYLDSYGFDVPQGSTKNQLIAWARTQRTYFRYGTTTPQGTLWAKL
jgi:hypothetical protein